VITKGMATKPSWPFSAQPEVDDADDMIYRYQSGFKLRKCRESRAGGEVFFDFVASTKSTQLSSFDGQPAQYQDDARLICINACVDALR